MQFSLFADGNVVRCNEMGSTMFHKTLKMLSILCLTLRFYDIELVLSFMFVKYIN